MFIQRFFKIQNYYVLRRRPYFTRVRAKVTISFEKLTNEPSTLKKKFQCYFEKLLKSKTVQLVAACHVNSQGLCYM